MTAEMQVRNEIIIKNNYSHGLRYLIPEFLRSIA